MDYTPAQRAAYKAGVAAARTRKSAPRSYSRAAAPSQALCAKGRPSKGRPRRSAAASTAPAAIGTAPGNVGLNLSSATEAYMHAMVNPSDAPAAGMPIGGVPSEKNKCWARGRMSTGTAGVGYILGTPGGITQNDARCAVVTGPLFAGTTLSNTVVANNVIAVNGNSPYSSAQYGATLLKSRFVCGEIRVRYIGTELNRGGDAVVYCDTNHNSLLGYSEANLLSYAACGRSFISMQEWISCKYNGVVDPTEENFVTDSTSSVLAKNSAPCMVIWINSAVPAQPFDYEVWGHFEVIGSLGASMTTTNPDPTGHTATNSAAQTSQISHPGSHDEHDYGTTFMGKLFHTVTTGVTKVGDILSDKGTQKVISDTITRYGPKILKGLTKAAPLLLL